MKKNLILLLGAMLLLGAGGWYALDARRPATDSLTLYGNVDIRQISLAFEYGGRLTDMTAEEGDRVTRGQPLARVDTRELNLKKAQLTAEISVQEQALLRLENGNRPEEIAQARAQLDSARANDAQAEKLHRRMQELLAVRAVSKQDADNAQAAHEVARAKRTEAAKALRLMQIGPRAEDIEAARARLVASRAALALLDYQLDQAELTAPADAVISARLLEPGSMVSAQTPVYTLSLTSPKWVRVYVTEAQLGQIRPGLTAAVTIDSAPDQPVAGQVGYISSSAEFTPKTVQTAELRTALLYEVRVLVDDAQDRLRLGMPATVTIPLRTLPAKAK